MRTASAPALAPALAPAPHLDRTATGTVAPAKPFKTAEPDAVRNASATPHATEIVVRDGEISTPSLSTSILPGITRDTVIQIAQDLGYVVSEQNIIRSDLYLADEVFMCGTAAEVTPLRSIDDYEIGVGPITLKIQEAYLDTVRGRTERWAHWLDRVVPAPTKA